MKKFSEQKEKLIQQWGEARAWKEKDYVEYVFNRVSKGTQYTTIHTKKIWVYKDLIFNKKKDMISYKLGEN